MGTKYPMLKILFPPLTKVFNHHREGEDLGDRTAPRQEARKPSEGARES